MQPIIIREATLDDLETLLQFEQGVISAERPFDPTLKEDPILYYDLKQLLTSPNSVVMAAMAGDEIVGSGYARIEESKPYFKYDRYAYMGFMYVRPDHRGKGVNQLVIEALQEWSTERGVTEFHLQVYFDNLPAIKAYEKVGFVKDMLMMRMEIPPKN